MQTIQQQLDIWTPQELSFSEANGRRTVEGYAAVYFNEADAGTKYSPMEGVQFRIARGAFDAVLSKNKPITALWSHDWSEPLGDTVAGNLRIAADMKGLKMSLDLPATSRGNDAWTLVKSGIVRGMSFSALRGFDKWTKENGQDVLTFYRFATLDEVTLTKNPAFVGTSLAVAMSNEAKAWAETESRLEFVRSLTK